MLCKNVKGGPLVNKGLPFLSKMNFYRRVRGWTLAEPPNMVDEIIREEK